jgi:hypothetical protein
MKVKPRITRMTRMGNTNQNVFGFLPIRDIRVIRG